MDYYKKYKIYYVVEDNVVIIVRILHMLVDSIKQMMVYIHEHYSEIISVSQLAEAACQMLVGGQETITDISRACGLGSGSYFAKIFREYAHCTPSEYRGKWQDSGR